MAPESICQFRRYQKCGFDPWVGKLPCRKEFPWTEEPGGLQFTLSQRGRHDWSDLALIPLFLCDLFCSWHDSCIFVFFSNAVLHFVLPADTARFLMNDRGIGVFTDYSPSASVTSPTLDASVSSGCSNRNTIDWVVTNNRNLFLTVLEAESPAYGNSLQGCRQPTSFCLLTWQKDN